MHNAIKLTEAIAKDALSAVVGHPLQAEAISWAHCVSDVFAQPKSFVDRARFSDEQRSSLYQALDGVSTILLVSYWTSHKKPEPMSGLGKLYVFLLHPETFAVLQTDVSTWRS